MHSPPVVLTIAGSDCSAGAGIQADLKTFSAHQCHGLTAVTCVVAESPHKLVSIHAIPPAVLQDQVSVLLETYQVQAIKTGMLYSKPHIVAISEILEGKDIPMVVDPVMVASSGSSLLKSDAISAYTERLLPQASLLTPNMPEASVLLDRPITHLQQLEDAALEIAEKFQTSCLLKGGHLPMDQERVDILCHQGQVHSFRSETLDIEQTHGTGCTLSAAIAARLAHQHALPVAVEGAQAWVHQAIAGSFRWDMPTGGQVLALDQTHPAAL